MKQLDIDLVRKDFPILGRRVHEKPLIYLDNAATSQKPTAVIDALRDYYTQSNANIHRGVHLLSEEATAAYENVREISRDFLGASESREIVFVRGTTEAINLVAQAYARPRLQAGDEILISHMEHHSNIVPWQILCQQTGALLRVAPITDEGELDIAGFEQLLGPKTKFVSLVHVSNALGTINPVKSLVAKAKAQGVPVLLDGAQAAPHIAIDVQDIDCDFYTLSGHKVYGPTGIGVLYGRESLLEEMEPYQGGGEMILSVSFEKTTYNKIPHKFEAGTPNIAGTVGLGAALQYVNLMGIDSIAAHEHELLTYATEQVQQVPGIKIIGTAREKAGVLSFVLDGVHPHDVGTILDQEGIAVRTGHHCAQPVMDRFGIPATTRASFAVYNTRAEIDRLMAALDRVRDIFS